MSMRVIIADDHPTVRAGVRLLLNHEPTIEIVAEADSPDSLLARLEEGPVDLLITDFSMPVGQAVDGLGLLGRIRREHPDLPIIVLTMVSNVSVHGSILATGVRALVDKAAGMEEISLAVEAIAHGRKYVSTAFRKSLEEREIDLGTGASPSLSPRETEVLRLFASGLKVSIIAERLARSMKTISRQKTDAMAKLGLRSDLEIYEYARKNNLLP